MSKIISNLTVQADFATVKVVLPKPKLSLSGKYIIMMASILSIVATFIAHRLNLIVAYNDARAHLNMSRLVIDNLNPGLIQLGSVWLPLNHLLTLTLVWNDWLWQTGLAGSIFSMIAYVLSTLAIFVLIKKVLADSASAWLGALAFATNLNMLYMQATPMTEALLLLFFILATYFLYRWVQTRSLVHLLGVGSSVCLATLTRYDGWFLFLVNFAVIAYVSAKSFLVHSKSPLSLSLFTKALRVAEGKIFFYATIGSFGIFLWILWNWLIFADPLYFAYGPYSARAQQARIEAAGTLLTKYNLSLSLTAYWWAMVNNMGLLLVLLAIIGLVVFYNRYKFSFQGIAVYTLLVPLVFHVLSLYLGHSVLALPELGFYATEASSYWFNTRYGLMMLPAVAFFTAFITRRSMILKLVLICLIFLQAAMFIKSHNIITITDGVVGTSSLQVADASEWLQTHAADNDELILTSIFYNNALTFSTGMPLKRFIHEGTGTYWNESLVTPERHAEWIVMANGAVGDPVYDALVTERKRAFLNHYILRETFKHLSVYQRKAVPTGFVYTSGANFEIDGQEFRFVGVNSYDLIYRKAYEVEETLRAVKNAGITVVRLWIVGEGLKDGVHPEPTVVNEEKLKDLDYILRIAEELDLKLILVLSNYWENYGGAPQYLQWAALPTKSSADRDQFFTSPQIREIYKQYVKQIVGRVSTQSQKAYVDSPVIFAWELMNEPRSSSSSTSQIVTRWISEMSEYIRSLDPDHLILSGDEGFVLGSVYTSQAGPSMQEVSALPVNEVVTAHYYKNANYQYSQEFSHPIVASWSDFAKSLQKPLLIEEIGISKNPDHTDGIDRDTLYANFFKEAEAEEVDGVMLWNWALRIDDSFGISPKDKNDTLLIELIRTYASRIEQERNHKSL